QHLPFNSQTLRDFDKANKAIDRALALDPTATGPLEVKSKLAILERGDFSVAETAFEAVKSLPLTDEQELKTAVSRAEVFLLERTYEEGLQQAESLQDDDLARFPGALWGK